MLKKVKELVRRDEEQAAGGRPSARLVDALKVLAVESPGLADRAVAYVHQGEGPEVLLELEALRGGDVEALLGRPGRVREYSWATPAQNERLRSAVPDWTLRKAAAARSALYTLGDAVTVPELVRLGKVLSAVSSVVDRERPTDPRWLTVLVNDMARRVNDRREGGDGEGSPDPWTPDLMLALAVDGGVPEADAPAVVLRELFGRPTSASWSWRYLGPTLLGASAREFVVAQGDVAAQALSGVSVEGREGLVALVASDPASTDADAHLLARLAADTSKGVREAAVAAVAQLPGERQREVLTPLLTSLPAARLGVVVTRLAQVDGGLTDLERVAEESTGTRATLLRDAVERARVLEEAQDDEPTIEVPPFEPLPETTLGDDFVRAARTALDTMLERSRADAAAYAREGGKGWPRRRREIFERDLKELPGITDDILRGVAAFLSGSSKRRPDDVAMRRLYEHAVFSRLPETTLMHRLRFHANVSGGRKDRFGWFRLNDGDMLDIDLRVLDEALRRIGRDDAETLIDELYFSSWWAVDTVSPENAWPYYVGRLDRLAVALDDRERTYGTPKPIRALAVLAQLPQIPRRFLPRLSDLALGEGRAYRVEAQEVLRGHPGARELAEQGLGDSKSDVRRTAAEWLARLGDADAVPALRATLTKERSEVVRAAILTSLESLGEDISGDLAPDVLLAEATKGLRAKAPVSMAWFEPSTLPDAHWAADGSPVDPTILRWWVVLAVKLKDPCGAGLIERYLSLLQAKDRARLGSHVLGAWVAQDTRNPSPQESEAHATAGAQGRYDWYQVRAKRSPYEAEFYASQVSKSVEDHHRDMYREHQATYLGSAVKDKGMLALTVAMPGGELAETFQRYAKAHIGRRSQTEALVQALAANGQPAAIQELLAVSRRFRQATVQETAQRLASELADRRGWTADQLADRTVQTAGFEDDGLLHLDLGSREYVGRITPAFTLELTSDAGKVVKALPAARASDDPELVKAAKKQLTTSRKELKAVVSLQTQRLYEAMCVGRTWTAQEWQDYVLGHPVMSRLAERLVWVENPGADGARAFRPDAGALLDVDDEDVELGESSTVGLAHAVLLGADASAAWAAHLVDYEVEPLFAQLDVTAPTLDAAAASVADHEGWLSDSFSIRGRATKRGYTRSQAEDGGWFTAYSKNFASAGIVVQIEFTGSFLPEENIPAAVTRLTFVRTGRGAGRSAPRIADLPPVLVAEAYRDYVAVAEAGAFDPDWEKKSRW